MSKKPTLPRDIKAVQAEILNLRNPVAGTLSEVRRTLKDGTPKTYHILQRTVNGKHTSQYVPPGQLEAVKAGIKERKKLDTLVEQWLATGTHATLATPATETQHHADPDAEAKKKRTLPLRKSALLKKLKKPINSFSFFPAKPQTPGCTGTS